jgi:glutamate-1-semialdehyde 2,1-aminomutase
MNWPVIAAGVVATTWFASRAVLRLQLSRAKHPSLQGHPRLAKLIASAIPAWDYDASRFFNCDGAPEEVERRRREAFAALSAELRGKGQQTQDATAAVVPVIPDLEFTTHYRVPFQFARHVAAHLPPAAFVQRTDGPRVVDLDGRESFDLAGSYGVNVFGHEFYKRCIDAAVERARELGPVLGPYHPIVAENVERLRQISGHDAVSFHMSGTEAVMQAVRLARYHTGRSHVVRFPGAYHGWWDEVQPGIGNPAGAKAVYTLRDMDERTLGVLRTRRDIACVLVNPLQVLHPNAGPPSDSTLLASDRRAAVDIDAYKGWLARLRAVCSSRSIVLIFDEVFLGFRLAYRGAQDYFGVKADLVTYGKTVAGGLPIGVVCGRADLMRRYRDDRPSNICFARGTFNTHPYVMCAMHEFLRRLEEPGPDGAPPLREHYRGELACWTRRFTDLNDRLAAAGVPVRVVHLGSIATVLFTVPSRYNWLLQFYLRANGLLVSWVGTGRLIFSHDYTDSDFEDVCARFCTAATTMRDAGWWWKAPALTNRSIHWQITRELLSTAWRRRTWPMRRADGKTPARSIRREAPGEARGDTA